MLNIINSKIDKLRDELDNRRKRKLKRDEDLTISRKKRNRRFRRKHKKNSSCRERRKARKAAITKSKMENIKNFSDIELTENHERALCLGQGFVVSKSFKLGNFLLDWNKFKNKIRWRLFFGYKDNSSPVHPCRKSSGRPAPVGSGFESKCMKNVFLSCEKEFVRKEFKVRAAKFKGNVTFLEKLGIKELISNPDITIVMQDKSKQLVVINTSEYDS